MKREATLTSGSVGMKLLLMTLPMIPGHFAMVAFNFADRYFISDLGTLPLAAIGFILPVEMVISSVALGLAAGTGSLVSQAIGSGDGDAQRIATDSLILSVTIVAILSVAGMLTIDPVFKLMGATEDVMPLIRQYMTIWYIGMAFVVVPMVGNNAVRATGDTIFPSVVMIAGAGVNFALDPLLIYGWGPFPRLEMRGAALATVFGRMMTMTAALLVLHYRHRLLSFARPRLAETLRSWVSILNLAGPAAATSVLFPLSMFVVTRIVAGYGEEAVAATGAGWAIQNIAVLPLISLSTVIIAFTGQNWGARKIDRLLTGKTLSFQFAIVWGFLCALVLALAARPLARVFSDKPAVLDNIVIYLWIVPLSLGPGAIPRLVGMMFNGVGRPMISMKINAIYMIGLLIPASWLGSITFGFPGILLGNVVAGVLAAVFSHFVLRTFLRDAAITRPVEAQPEISEAPATRPVDTDPAA